MFIAESTPSTITGHADTFALILTLVIGFWFNVIEYTSIDLETNTTVTAYKKGALRFFFDGVFRFREFYRSRREPVRNVRITWGFSSRRETWHVWIATKFHHDPTVEMWLRVCSNDHAPLTVLPYIIFILKIKNCLKDDLFISCDDRIGKMLHNICISALTMLLRWVACGPLVQF